MRIKPTPSRRNVVIDIETAAHDPADPKGALSALSGRIVCVCLLIDDGEEIREVTLIGDEVGILQNFWNRVQPNDVFIGWNLLTFDLLWLRQRSIILGVRPSRKIDLKKYYTAQVIDLMQLWSNWGAQKYVSLNQIAGALGCGGKTGDGAQVTEWWQAGQIEKIAQYCLQDVRITYLVFLRMMLQAVPARFTSSLARQLLVQDQTVEAESSNTDPEPAPTSTLVQ